MTYEPETDMFFPSPNAIMLLPGGRWYTMASVGEDKQEYIGQEVRDDPADAAARLGDDAGQAHARADSARQIAGTGHIPREGVVMDRIVVTRW